MVEQAFGLTLAANQADRIDVEQQRRLAARRAGLGIEHPRRADIQRRFVQALGMLVQQISEVGRRLMRGRDGEEHAVR